jgi:hypothetical protein
MRPAEGIRVDPDLAEREDIKDSLHLASGCVWTGLVALFFAWGSWWSVIAVFVLVVGRAPSGRCHAESLAAVGA